MDIILCDELVYKIFSYLPCSSLSKTSLVSKRWLYLSRSSLNKLSINPKPYININININNFLSYFPFLTSLSISLSPNNFSNNNSLLNTFLSSLNPNLTEFNIYSAPVHFHFLLNVSLSCPKLQSLSVFISRPFCLYFLSTFLNLKKLSITFVQNPSFDLGIENHNLNSTHYFSSIRNDNLSSSIENCNFSSRVENRFSSSDIENPNFGSTSKSPNFDVELKLESLTLSFIRTDDYGLDWLYKSSKNLKKLQFRGCEGIGDNPSSLSFTNCIKNIEEVEFRTCRMIISNVLIKIAENCENLKSLLVYDGGCREGLLRFIELSVCDLQKVDFRLPLDLNNRHLLALGEKFRNLSSLRLESCCLVTGEGLERLCFSTKDRLEELALINCDVAEKRQSGLVTNLGQSLKGLKRLDLSYNETMVDKKFVSMIVSCGDLRELKVRGCRELSNLALASISKCCKNLETLDIMYCYGIKAKGVELFVLNSPRLRMLKVEESKVLNEVVYRGLKLVHERSSWHETT